MIQLFCVFVIFLFCVIQVCVKQHQDRLEEERAHQDLPAIRDRLAAQRRQQQSASTTTTTTAATTNGNRDDVELAATTAAATAIAPSRTTLIDNALLARKIDRPESVRSLETILRIANGRATALSTRRQNDNNDDSTPQQTSTNNNVVTRSYRAVMSSIRSVTSAPSGRSSTGSSGTTTRECCICLDTYAAGDVVVWAKTDACDHIFHQACAREWLQQHDDCPLCRTPIL